MTSTKLLRDAIALGRRRWLAPLIADLAVHRGARFVPLLSRLGIARDSLDRTLGAAMAAGWVIRNPGHGHPLRPEYILTPEGERLATIAAPLLAAQARLDIAPGMLTCWGMPILHLLGDGLCRFNDLTRALADASPRALSQALRVLAAHELITRTLIDGYPPTSHYRLTDSGNSLASAVAIRGI